MSIQIGSAAWFKFVGAQEIVDVISYPEAVSKGLVRDRLENGCAFLAYENNAGNRVYWPEFAVGIQ